jgi:2-phosphosulfolactate phosphatase
MGKGGLEPAEEDELCASYILSLLTGHKMQDIDKKLKSLANGGGRHFFDPSLQHVFPEKDFWMCIDRNRFDFVLKIDGDRNGLVSKMIRLGEK